MLKPTATISALAVAALLGMSPSPAPAQPIGDDIDVYFVGNSLTRGISQDRLAWLFDQAGGDFEYGTQGAANNPLNNHLNNTRDDGATPLTTSNESNTASLNGNYQPVLQNTTIDALVLQPYQYWLNTNDTDTTGLSAHKIGDRQAINGFIDYARGNNPSNNAATQRFFIYGTWPQLIGVHYRNPNTTSTLGAPADDPPYYPDGAFGNSYTDYTFADFYAEPYLKAGEGTHTLNQQVRQSVPTRDFYVKLINAVNTDNSNLTAPVSFIPTGDVLAALDEKIRNGQLPGVEAYFIRPDNEAYYRQARNDFKQWPMPRNGDGDFVAFDADFGIVNFYTDNVHMNDQPHNSAEDGTIGGYVSALTMYAVLTGESPVGLPAYDPVTGQGWERLDPKLDAGLITALQETVWDVVRNDPLTNVPEPGSLGLLGTSALLLAVRRRGA